MSADRTVPLDLDFVRAQFPALSGDWVFLDNAGGSQVLGRVVDRISDYLKTSNVQLGASYAISQLAGERQQEAQRRTAELVNAERPEEVVMGPTSTLLVQLLARAMARQFTPGDEVVVTRADHESNIGAWVRLESIGVIPRFWELDPDTKTLELAELDRIMSPRTRLVAFTHASNIFGTIHPVKEITRFVHDRGAKVCVDGVAYAPHRAVDVRAWDVDYYVLSLYKVYGPHHALLYGKYAHLLELDNLYHYFIANDRIPYKLQPGNPNYELSYGSIGITEYLAELGARTKATPGASPRSQIESAFAAIADHEESLSARLLSYLSTKPRVKVIGATSADKTVRVPTISFVADGLDSETIVRHIDALQIGIRFGDFHSRRLVEHLDLSRHNGAVRVSMVHYNTVEEIDRLIQGLDRVI
jgi:cysteine desulfurase family protein (TIGR01976 family)